MGGKKYKFVSPEEVASRELYESRFYKSFWVGPLVFIALISLEAFIGWLGTNPYARFPPEGSKYVVAATVAFYIQYVNLIGWLRDLAGKDFFREEVARYAELPTIKEKARNSSSDHFSND